MMRRLGRWIFNAAAAISLLLCVAMVALWIRSYYFNETMFFSRLWRSPLAHSVNGQLAVEKELGGDYSFLLPGYWRLLHRSTPIGAKDYHCDLLRDLVGTGPHLLGFGIATRDPGWSTFPRTLIRYVVVPDWSIVILFAVPPIVWLANLLWHRSRSTQGGCLVCGYDLRATPDRCPECGTVAEKQEGVTR